MRYKFAVLTFATALLLFVFANFAVWMLWTRDLLTDANYDGGDLARLGYFIRAKVPRKNSDDLPRRHIEIKDYTGGRVDMITLGDSFTNGGAGGKNRYYQDYIASRNNIEVLNIKRIRGTDFITNVSLLLNSGYFERFHPRYLLLSTAERGCLDLAVPVDFNRTMTQDEITHLKTVDFEGKRPDISFVNDGNVKFLLYSLLYRFSDHAYFSDVYIRELKQEMFSAADGHKLLFLKCNKFLSTAGVHKLNDNLNTLADRLAVRGIHLVFMPCVEKYNLYCDFLVNNPYPRSYLFEELRQLPRRYAYIDTKAILSSALLRGEKDVFYADDTHWSWKASEIIFDGVRFDQRGSVSYERR